MVSINNDKQYELEEKIKNILPHGSGINYKWNIKITLGSITCYNKYDYMNKKGYYDGIYPFSIRFTPTDITLHFHNIPANIYKKIKDDGIRDYLEETFANVHNMIKPYIITKNKRT